MTKRARAKPKRAKRTGVSLRSLARRLGVSLAAVQKAIASGRLRASVGRDARKRPRILDLQVATREWRENATKPPPPTNGNGNGASPATFSPTASLIEAQRRLAGQRELKLDLENQKRQGTLIDAAAARRESFEIARTVRDAILNVPDRVAAELAAETDAGRVHRRLEQELRSALVNLAETLGDEPAPLAAVALRGAGLGDSAH